MRKWISTVRPTLQQLAKLSLNIYAANATFFLLLSAFPIAMLLASLLRYLPLDAALLLDTTAAWLPAQVQELFEYLLSELYSADTGTILPVSVVLAIWSASKGVLGIMSGLNAAYAAEEHRVWVLRRLLCMAYTVGLIIVIVVLLALHTFGQQLQTLLVSQFPRIANWINGVFAWRIGIVLAIMIPFFAVLFMAFPARKLRFMHQLPGACIAALGWLGFSAIYSFYLEHFSSVAHLYGSLTTVMVTMLWMYFSICIVFYAASINVWLQDMHLWKT